MSIITRNSGKLPLVAIVGRPNVGKSSLFNRLTGTRRAIVTDEPGITRDRLYGRATWLGRTFEVVDTGGLVPDERATMAQEILRQARVAIEAASTVVLVVDARAGVTPLDADLARLLRRTGKPVVLAANKVDTGRLTDIALPFHELGIQPVIPLSAEHGLGVDDLLDVLVKNLEPSEESEPRQVLNVAIIGRPNVGKSTLLNQLVGDERAIVSPEPGTTRDAVDTLIPVDGGWWRLIDTAGIRRKGKTRLLAEKLSVIMARKHLERADVAVLLLDATEGVTSQDATIGGYAHESGRSVIVTVNKWDTVDKARSDTGRATAAVRGRLKFLDYAPVVFISALKGQHLGRLRSLIAQVGTARQRRLTDAELKEFVDALPLGRTTVPGGRPVRIHSIRQVGAAPPVFLVRANLPKLHFAFERFLVNQLRERFGFFGTPIRLKLERGGKVARARRR
ncbi:MAG TPA: ribosome biogenesis GTPase Der [Candidatus Xenobia bacterium]|nr:ribosome biogenesis GTPase Der [Candidatus Xenobia bacterium]